MSRYDYSDHYDYDDDDAHNYSYCDIDYNYSDYDANGNRSNDYGELPFAISERGSPGRRYCDEDDAYYDHDAELYYYYYYYFWFDGGRTHAYTSSTQGKGRRSGAKERGVYSISFSMRFGNGSPVVHTQTPI